MSSLRDDTGRLHLVWRLALFVLFALFFLGAAVSLVGALAGWLLPEAASGLVALVAGAAALLAVLAASWLVMAWLENAPVAALGLPLDGLVPAEIGRGAALGIALIAFAVVPLALAGSIRWIPSGSASIGPLLASLAVTSGFLFLAALLEELLLRGYPLQALAERAGGPAAIAITAIVFSLLHAYNPGFRPTAPDVFTLRAWLPLLNITLAGVLLGLAFWRTYSLWFAGGVHFGWNWGMGFAADVPVSGLDTESVGYAFLDTPGFDAVVAGPELWTGGGFGPEGGLAVTLVLAGACVWLARTPRLSRSLRVRALGPLPDRGGWLPAERRAAEGEPT